MNGRTVIFGVAYPVFPILERMEGPSKAPLPGCFPTLISPDTGLIITAWL